MSAKAKMRFLPYIMAGVALGVISCQDENEETFVPQAPNTPTFNLEICDPQESRTTINGTTISWAEGDKIAIFYGSTSSPLPFSVTTTDNGATATCDIDTVWEQGETFYATYPYSNSLENVHSIPVELPTIFTQTSTEATELGNYDIMVAEPVVWSNEEPVLKFHHAVSFIDFVISNDSDDPMDITGVELTTEDDILPISGTIDATLSAEGDNFAQITPTEFCSNIKINASGTWTTLEAGNNTTLRMAIIPANLSDQIITVTFKTSTGDKVIETYGIDLKPGYVYGFNKSFGWDGSSQPVEGLTEFKFTTTNNNGLYQDIVFTKQNDNSFSATVVPEVDLSSIIPTFDYNGKVTIDGQKITNNKTAIDFRDEMMVKFDNKRVKFTVNREYAIPVVYINTDNAEEVTTKEYYLGCRIKIDGKNMYEDYVTITEADSIRGRGNSTWLWYDKKPYRLKLDKKAGLLGMGEGKSYVLLANYRDPSNMMNAVTFDMARYMEMPYTNSNRFVEVYLNDEYLGMYLMTEQVQQGGGRVDVEKEGGYLLSLDYDDGPDLAPYEGDNFLSEVFSSSYSPHGLPICVKHPEDQTQSQLDAIRAEFAKLERVIDELDYEEFEKIMNVQSFIDFLIIQEMTRNVELVTPRSMYMHRHANGVWAMGPVWDFDGGFAYDWGENHGYFSSQSWIFSDNLGSNYNNISDFFDKMFNNADFAIAYKARWNEISDGMLNYAFQQLDNYVLHCKGAIERNRQRWPINKSDMAEISKLKNWLKERATRYQQVVDNM